MSWVFDLLAPSQLLNAGDGVVVTFTQANQTVAASAAQNDNAQVTFTQGAQTVSASSAQNDNATVSFTQAGDTVSASTIQVRTAQVTFTQAGDTVAASGSPFDAASVVYTQANNTIAASASQLDTAQVTVSQAAQTVAASASQNDTAQVTVSQAAQTCSITVTQTDHAAITFTQDANVAVSSAEPALPYGSWWGGWFPQPSQGQLSWWGGVPGSWFPEGEYTTIPGVAPPGIATFELKLESAARIRQAWRTGLFKSYSGRERRANVNDDPAMVIEGTAYLIGDQSRAARARLARYAAAGEPFLIGLPHEELTVRANSVGPLIPVFNTALSDWVVPGCRVIVEHNFYGSVEGVIQSYTSNSITLDVSPGDVGKKSARIMPAIACYLDPQQGFSRYPKQIPDQVEAWSIRARAINPGFMSSAVPASLELASVTTSGNLDGLRIVARAGGADTDDIAITQTDDALTSGGEFSENVGAKTIHIKYMGDVTTVAEYMALFSTMTLVRIEGTPDDVLEVVNASDDEFVSNLSGGADAQIVDVGRGATVTLFAGRPIWDRGIIVDGTSQDSLQSMAEAADLGGLPFMTHVTMTSDWGREVHATGELGEPYQWLKAFLDEIKGMWRGFWLPTWRQDLLPVSSGSGTLTVYGGENAGDLFAWWPVQRSYIQILQDDDTVTWARIDDASDNGDDTITLNIVDEDDNPITLSGAAIDAISWLELVRSETDIIEHEVGGAIFRCKFTARAIQDYLWNMIHDDDFLADEASIETSQPREGIEFVFPSSPIGLRYRVATGTRDVTIGGFVFHAEASARGQIVINPVGNGTDDIEIQIPMAHAVPQRWMAGAVPPKRVVVNVWRKQLNSGVEEIVWSGEILELRPDGHVGKFLVPSTLGRKIQQTIPTLTAARTCGNILYDTQCRVDMTTRKVTATVLSFTGRTLVVSTMSSHPDGWAVGGFVKHTPSGEPMTVFSQHGTTIEMQFPIWEMAVGDTIEIYQGCPHTVEACRDDFDNVVNFTNAPDLPIRNPMRAQGFGVITQF